MESSSLILFASTLGVTTLSVTILYFLYKCLMRETPYQRTFLIDEVDSKHKENDKKLAKKSKTTVRQRIVNKPVSEEKNVLKEMTVEKSALNAGLVLEIKTSTVSESGSSGSSESPKWNQGDKTEVKRKVEKAEKVQSNLKPGKKAHEDVVEGEAFKQVGRSFQGNREDRLKTKTVETIVTSLDAEHQKLEVTREEKKFQLKQNKESSKQSKELPPPKHGKEQDQEELNLQPHMEKKKKNKKSNEDINSSMDQRVKHDDDLHVPSTQNKQVVEEVLVEQKVKVATGAPSQQQPAINNKKKTMKAKAPEEFNVVDEIPAFQSELKQKTPFGVDEVASNNNTKQQQAQQQNVAKTSSGDVEYFKRLLSEKEAITQRDQMQLKTLNEALFQLKKELTSERNRHAEVENSMHAVNKKHTEERQNLLNSLHQKDQQGKQAIQLLQQELQAAKARPNDLSIIMSNLAEENAKLKAEMSRAEKQLNEEMAQRSKTVDLLNESLRKLEHSDMNIKSLEMKFKQADEKSRNLEIKQKDTTDAVGHMEKLYYDLQQEHQHLKMQEGQTNAELQNQLRAAKVESDELHALVDRLKKDVTDLEKELFATRDANIISESLQQEVVNGCNQDNLVAHLEDQLSQQHHDNKQLTDKLDLSDMKNQTLESERDELLVALDNLTKKADDLEKQLETNKTPPIPLEPSIAPEHHVGSQVSNGCGDSEFITRLEATLAEREESCKALLEKLETKDSKNEELRQRNWKVMEVLADYEKKMESIKRDHESQLKGLHCEVDDLKNKLVEAEQKSLKVENVLPVASKNEVESEVREDPEVENVKQLTWVAKANQLCIDKQEDEIRNLIQELKEQQIKNDKLRENNWTIMTSLNEADKKIEILYEKLEQSEHQMKELESSSSSSSSHVQNQLSPSKSSNGTEEIVRKEYTIINEVKESCQWDMSQLVLDIDSKTAELQILQSLLDQHENSLAILTAENNELRNNSPSKEASETSAGLEQKVEHYKTVLADTESILKSLEASVYAEENKWKRKIENLEMQLQGKK